MTTFKDLIRRVKSEVHEVSPDQAREMAGRGAVIVDVREADEWVQGHIPGALFIPRGFLELRIEEKVPDKSRELVLQEPEGGGQFPGDCNQDGSVDLSVQLAS